MVHRNHRIIGAIAGTALVLALWGVRTRSGADEDSRFQTIEQRFPNRAYDFLAGQEPSVDSLVAVHERTHLGTPFASYTNDPEMCLAYPCRELTDELKERVYSELLERDIKE